MSHRKAVLISSAVIGLIAFIITALVAGAGTGTPSPQPRPAGRTSAHEVAGVESTTSTTAAPEASATEAAGERTAAPDDARSIAPTSASTTHDVIPGSGVRPPVGSDDLIGDLDDDHPVPDGFGLAPTPPKPQPNPGLQGPGDLAVEKSCAQQCITKGVAYARGFGAQLVVKTNVPAELFITAIADKDGDGEYEETHQESTQTLVTSHSWVLDHLAPGETYHVMVAATDEDDHTAYVWGEFTTLSHRNVFVQIGDTQVSGGPDDITSTGQWLGMDDKLMNVTPGQQGILKFNDQPRYVDFSFWVLRHWHEKVCEGFIPTHSTAMNGHDGAACVAWNSVTVDDVDLDKVPAATGSFTQTTVKLNLHADDGEGDALPPGYGDPYWFWFSVPVTLYVTYS